MRIGSCFEMGVEVRFHDEGQSQVSRSGSRSSFVIGVKVGVRFWDEKGIVVRGRVSGLGRGWVSRWGSGLGFVTGVWVGIRDGIGF